MKDDFSLFFWSAAYLFLERDVLTSNILFTWFPIKYLPWYACRSTLHSKICCEIPGTENQADSPRWYLERRYRITTSKYKTAVTLGVKISDYDSLHPNFKWLQKNFGFQHTFVTNICNMVLKMKSMF